MTPLAHQIIKELTLPISRRTFRDNAKLLPRMAGVHCFECSEVFEAARYLASDMAARPASVGRLAFLPSPRTWIEWNEPDGRIGALLREVHSPGGQPYIAITDFAIEKGFGSAPGGLLELVGSLGDRRGDPRPLWLTDMSEADQPGLRRHLTFLLYAFLAMINAPRVINRRQHMPHRGLERDLTRAMKPVGKFPLNAWTEIQLRIGPPQDAGQTSSCEAHLTGTRALHFCRAHLRIRMGQLEIVRSHWRGDASLGIKQSRYKLAGEATQ